ncbi:hypothetical protein D0Z00_002784 [Geotrichum galactomycetum]|uniref:Uncharacterized protein n=1 Tax=Geotrichum galactomycetum TaxID=27317 RepID=A0ACB6V363_9ASCO|nr:hypothetical protein D0Z00_002784 [Geotrichum candidum]
MSTPRPSSHGFQRASTNKLFTRDIDTIFSMLMVALSPQEHSRRRKQSFLSPKPHPFSFTVEEALTAIQNLSVKIVSGSTKTTISCSVSPSSAGLFLERFMSARLLHCPADRTRSTPKHGTVLQPTAKGVFFIQRYCDTNGVIYNSPLLLSPLNSMRCFSFDRDPASDAIIRNDALIYILFQRLMGPQPNVYSAASEPVSDSPYAHRYFTNPKSDALSQYYISDTGVRLSVITSDSTDGTAPPCYVFTGRAMWQWMLDCTDLVYQSEAHVLVNTFLAHNMIELDTPVNPNSSNMRNGRSRLNEDDGMSLDDNASGSTTHSNESSTGPAATMTAARRTPPLSLDKDVYYRLTDTGKYLVTWPIYANEPATPIASTYAQAAAAAAKALNREKVLHSSITLHSAAATPPPAPKHISDESTVSQQKQSIISSMLKASTILATPKSKPHRLNNSDTSSIFRVSTVKAPCPINTTTTTATANSPAARTTATPPVPDSPNNYTLRETLADAGLNWLFTQYLRDNHCEENLFFYKDLTKFLVDFARLRAILRRQQEFEADAGMAAANPLTQTSRMLLRAEAQTCLQTCNNAIYVMYNRFLSESAPCELNIDSKSRSLLVDSITSHLKRKGRAKSGPAAAKKLAKSANDNSGNITTTTTTATATATAGGASTTRASSPEVEDISIDNLLVVSKLLEQIKVHVYRTMETDSLPKFFMSDLYVEGMKSITALKKKLKQQQRVQMQSCN